LIDSGTTRNRSAVEKELEKSGCRPGDLKLILVTHGDSDHTGNAVFLRNRFGGKIAMHPGDSGMVERGDLLWGRKANFFIRVIGRLLSALPPIGLKKSDRFKPDISLVDSQDLAEYGFDAVALPTPGHSSGSVSILSSDGSLYCGDLFSNTKRPAYSSVYIERPVADATVEKLKKLNIETVYPGHGQPFSWEEYLRSR
jgi:glyoxylase-like metal-dependent hydrolase (beta-lactamase superfamily II)